MHAAVFGMKEGEVSTPGARGARLGDCDRLGPSGSLSPAGLAEVKDRVREDVVRDKAAELAKQRAASDRRRAEGRQGLHRDREESSASKQSPPS